MSLLGHRLCTPLHAEVGVLIEDSVPGGGVGVERGAVWPDGVRPSCCVCRVRSFSGTLRPTSRRRKSRLQSLEVARRQAALSWSYGPR